LRQELGQRVPTIRASPNPEAAADGADIVVAATTSTSPVIADKFIAPGTLVCGVGSHDPGASEIEPATVARAERVVVDTFAAVEGSGDINTPVREELLDTADIVQLGTLVLHGGPVRRDDSSIAVFKSVGFAAADIVAASLIATQALEHHLGTAVQLHD